MLYCKISIHLLVVVRILEIVQSLISFFSSYLLNISIVQSLISYKMIQIQSNTKYSITTRTLTLIRQNTEQFSQHKEP